MIQSGWQYQNGIAICGLSGSGRAKLMHQLATAFSSESIRTALILDESAEAQATDPPAYSLAKPSAGQITLSGATGHDLNHLLSILAPLHDLLLVAGDATTPLPKIWLTHPDQQDTIPEDAGILEVFAPGAARFPAAFSLIQNWLMASWINRPVMVAIHRSTSGQDEEDPSLLHHVALVTNLANRDDTLLLDFPAGDDLPGGEALLRTLRSRPGSAWLLAGTEEALPDAESMKALFEARRPGRWIIGFAESERHPLPLLIEPQAIPILDQLHGELTALQNHPGFYALEKTEEQE